MRILILNTTDIIGGAARAAYRIHKGLKSAGINSQMLVQIKASDDPTVIGPLGKATKAFNQLRFYLDSLPLQMYRNKMDTEWSVGWLPKYITGKISQVNPDIINLQWINGGFLDINALDKLNKPLVWTLHDCWAFTGGCNYPMDCKRYQEQCGCCPQLGSKSENDLSRWIWRQKAKHWRNLPLTVVAISHWVGECARSSSLFKNARIEVIPNGLDTKRYKIIDKKVAREILNLPSDKNLVLFGAMHVSQKRKGFHLLSAALDKLHATGLRNNMELAVFGSSPLDAKTFPDFPVHNLGYLHDDYSLALLYSACDVIAVPSTQEAFGQTASEAMACGTPAVAFNIGGIPDLIEHREDGYLARPFDTEDLAHGIEWVLSEESSSQDLGQKTRAKMEQKCSIERVAGNYLTLYEDILKRP